jgi:hypothetical protein
MVAVDDIQITGGPTIESLLEFSMSVKANEHGILRYHGIINEIDSEKILDRANKADLITVLLQGETFFIGQPMSISVSEQNGLFLLTTICLSTSCLSDVEEHSRSFQDTKMTYADLVSQIYNKFGDSFAITPCGRQTAIGKPVIQYEETDWAFTLRLASHLETVVVPDLRSGTPQIAFGFPRGKERTLGTAEEGRIGRFNSLYSGDSRRGSLHYTVESESQFNLGDRIVVQGMELIVAGKETALVGSVLQNTYTLGVEKAFGLPKYYHHKLRGVSLSGAVIGTEGECVRLHLDIDKSQEEDTAHWFPYEPQQGNVMYCMPQIGTKAWLTVCSKEEGDSVVEHCRRTNGQECTDMSDYHNRYFTTEFGKRMSMLPDLLSVCAGSNEINLPDQAAVETKTGKTTRIIAGGQIHIRSRRKILLGATERVIIEKTGCMSGFEASGGQLHTKSKKVAMKGNAGLGIAAFGDDMPPKAVELPPELVLKLVAQTPVVADTRKL